VAPAALHVIVSSPVCVGNFVKFRRASTLPNFATCSEGVLSPSAHRVVRWSLSLGVLLAGPIL
jgi:hypothetical protein